MSLLVTHKTGYTTGMDELRLLKTFLAVYRLGSVTKAATHLTLTQPGVSGHLRALESQLKKALFMKSGRGIAPTPAAHDLARAVAPHLDGVDVAFLAAKASAGELAGTVHLGGPAEFLSVMLGPKLANVLAVGIRLRIRFDLAQHLIKDLTAGTLDLAICTLKIRSEAVSYAPLYREEFVLVGTRNLGVNFPRFLSRSELYARLRKQPILSYAEDLPIIRRYWREIFDADIELQAAMVLPDLRGVVAAIVAGAGISVVPKYLCADLIATGDLAVLLENPRSPFNDIQLAWNKYALRHPRVAYLRDHILESFPRRES